MLARKGRTLITENALGLVQAAAGVDGSNVGATNWRCCPSTPTAAPRRCAPACASGSASTVGVVITDTMGRAWRNGQIDAAIGAAGLAVLHGYAGAVDRHGNELVVTEVAVADEIAAAADLVKGKLTAMPVAVVRGLARCATTDPPPDTLLRPGRGRPVLARHRRGHRDGPRPGPAAAPVGAPVQRASRSRRELIEAAVAEALTAPAPHHTRPVRFVWMADIATTDPAAGPHEGQVAVRPQPATAGPPTPSNGGSAAARSSTTHPNSSSRFWCPTARTAIPTPPAPPPSTPCSPSRSGAAVQALLVALAVRGVGSCWIGSTIFAADLVRAELELPADWEPLGAIAIGYPDEPSGPREPAPTDGLLVRK